MRIWKGLLVLAALALAAPSPAHSAGEAGTKPTASAKKNAKGKAKKKGAKTKGKKAKAGAKAKGKKGVKKAKGAKAKTKKKSGASHRSHAPEHSPLHRDQGHLPVPAGSEGAAGFDPPREQQDDLPPPNTGAMPE